MAPKVTSSSNRSKRSSSRPVTQGQNPQRSNRQRVSKANVSSSDSRTRNGGARITNASQRLGSGSARVTGTPTQAPKALPPGRQGGALATTTSRRDAVQSRLNNAAQGSSSNTVRTASGSAPKALPPARPRQPGTTRTEPTRRESAQYRQGLAAQGSRSSEVRIGQPGKPAAGSAARTARNVAGRAASALAAAGTGADAYSQARQRGETRGRSAAQGFSSAAGFAGGAAAGTRVGSMAGPWGAAIGGLAGGLLGSQGALRATQGIQEMGKAADRRGKDPNPPKPGTFGPATPRNNLYSTVPGRPVGQQAVINGKPVAWDGYNWKPSRSVGQASVDAQRRPASQPTTKDQPSRTAQGGGQTYGSTSPSTSYQGVSGRISQGVRGTSPMGSGSAASAMPGVSATESYRDGGSGLYQGSNAYRAAMQAKNPNSTGNPMLDRLRSDMASANYASQRQQAASSPTSAVPDAPKPPTNARLADAGAPKPPMKKNESPTQSKRNRRR